MVLTSKQKAALLFKDLVNLFHDEIPEFLELKCQGHETSFEYDNLSDESENSDSPESQEPLQQADAPDATVHHRIATRLAEIGDTLAYNTQRNNIAENIVDIVENSSNLTYNDFASCLKTFVTQALSDNDLNPYVLVSLAAIDVAKKLQKPSILRTLFSPFIANNLEDAGARLYDELVTESHS